MAENAVKEEIIDIKIDDKTIEKPKKVKKKKLTKLQQAQADLKELKDIQLRQAAEYENYKKRNQRESQLAIQRAGDYSITSFLPLLDDIERTLKSAKEHDSVDSFVEGIELMKNNFEKILESKGVVSIDSEGSQFDPEYHEAMMVEDNPKYENNVVIEVFERGFKHNDRVLRPAKVKVNRRSDGK